MTVPKILAVFVVLLVVNVAAMVTGLVYQLVEGAHEVGIPQYLGWFIIPAAIDGLLIAVLAVFVQVLSPNKYVGWGILFLWFVGDLPQQHGLFEPALHLRNSPTVPLSDFSGAGSFWKGAAVLQFYWLCFAVILAVVGASAVATRHRPRPPRTRIRRAPNCASDAGDRGSLRLAAVAMAATGAYAYYNIKVSSTATRPRTTSKNSRRTMRRNISSTRTCRSRRSRASPWTSSYTRSSAAW